MAAKSSEMEDMIRMRELRELLDLQEESERKRKHEYELECERERNLMRSSGFSWLSLIGFYETDFITSCQRHGASVKEEEKRQLERNHQAWIELQNFIAELRAISPRGESSFFCKFKQLVSIYTTIRYPNFVAVIQPKLHLINTIEA